MKNVSLPIFIPSIYFFGTILTFLINDNPTVKYSSEWENWDPLLLWYHQVPTSERHVYGSQCWGPRCFESEPFGQTPLQKTKKSHTNIKKMKKRLY